MFLYNEDGQEVGVMRKSGGVEACGSRKRRRLFRLRYRIELRKRNVECVTALRLRDWTCRIVDVSVS